jgi:hypothetical protein
MTRFIESITTFPTIITIKRKFHKKTFLYNFSFVCFKTFVVPNIPARGRKTEKKQRPRFDPLLVEAGSLTLGSGILNFGK